MAKETWLVAMPVEDAGDVLLFTVGVRNVKDDKETWHAAVVGLEGKVDAESKVSAASASVHALDGFYELAKDFLTRGETKLLPVRATQVAGSWADVEHMLTRNGDKTGNPPLMVRLAR